MTPETESRSTHLRPFWGRIMVAPSPVDEHEHSGLIIPSEYEGDDGVRRGIVLHIDNWSVEPTQASGDLAPGMVVYYRGGFRVLDNVVLERQEILAYEHEGDD